MNKLSPAFYTVALVGLCGYSAIFGPEHIATIPEVLANRAIFVGRELKLASGIEVVQVFPRELQVAQQGASIGVRVPENLAKDWEGWKKELKPGDFVSLTAVFQQEGYLLLRELHVHKGRLLKIWVSLSALLLLPVMLILERSRSPFNHA